LKLNWNPLKRKAKPLNERFFWLVQNSKGENLNPNDHVALVGDPGGEFLVLKTRATRLRLVRNEETGMPGIIVYVPGGDAPMVTGVIPFS